RRGLSEDDRGSVAQLLFLEQDQAGLDKLLGPLRLLAKLMEHSLSGLEARELIELEDLGPGVVAAASDRRAQGQTEDHHCPLGNLSEAIPAHGILRCFLEETGLPLLGRPRRFSYRNRAALPTPHHIVTSGDQT